MRIRHKTALLITGLLWMGIGAFLLLKGVRYLFYPEENTLFISHLKQLFSSDFHAFLIPTLIAVLLGLFKGKFALSKAAHRLSQNLLKKPDPCPIFSLYPPAYFFLLLGMCFMGISIKWLPIPYDVKAVIDMTVGFALSTGSSYFFRVFKNMNKNCSNKRFF
jgi:hypothetical protein